jgi:SOS response regulatory protein OraA/RecX
MSKTLKMKLLKKGYDPEICRKVIERLEENKFIDDVYNGKNYASELVNNKLYGYNIVVSRLEEKGLKRNEAQITAREAFEASGGEEEVIKRFIKKNSTQIKKLYESGEIEKIKSKLYNKGFGFSAINNSMKSLSDILSDS